MAKATISSVRAQSEKLQARWAREFAGKARHTRNLNDLEQMIGKMLVLVRKAKALRGDGTAELVASTEARLKLFREERDRIAEAQFDRPELGEIHTLGLTIDRAVAVWRRHFAGQDRRTRDLARLDALIGTMAPAIERMGVLAATTPEVDTAGLEQLRGQLEVFKDERSQIMQLRKNASDSDRAAMFMAQAQAAMERYRVHFAGQARASCSPEILEALIASVGEVGMVVRALNLGELHQENLAILDQQLTLWRETLALIRVAKAEVPPRAQTDLLGGIANQLFAMYADHFAGQARVSRDLGLLSGICDRLGDVLDLMTAHQAAQGDPSNHKNIGIVEERLRVYESEWVEIHNAKAATQPSPAPGSGAPAPGAVPPPVLPMPGITIRDRE